MPDTFLSSSNNAKANSTAFPGKRSRLARLSPRKPDGRWKPPLSGGSVAAFATEVAGKKVAKVYAIESPKLEPYTPDAFAAALKQFIESKQPKLVLMPHTYQVRDFVPKLATAMGRTVISDCIGYKKEGDKLLFTRQMFQGKFAADVALPATLRGSRLSRMARSAETRSRPAQVRLRSRRSMSTSPTASFATSRKKFSRKPSRPST